MAKQHLVSWQNTVLCLANEANNNAHPNLTLAIDEKPFLLKMFFLLLNFGANQGRVTKVVITREIKKMKEGRKKEKE